METFKETELLEPISLYETRLKDAFHQNAIDRFEEMTKAAKTNVDANQQFCKIYYEETKIADALSKKRGWFIFFLVLMIIIAAGMTTAGVIMILMAANGSLSQGLGIGLGIGLVVVSFIMLLPIIRLGIKIGQLSTEIEEHRKKAEEAKQAAYNEMKTLLNSYEWNMAASLFTRTTPLIQLDATFDVDKYQFLHDKFGYSAYKGKDMSTVFVQSGAILGNPFVFEKNYVQYMADHTYSGSLTITWTEYVTDSDGKRRSVTRTQVLTAYYTAPEPAYYYDTWLIYGNEAAPNLSFSRYPTNVNDMSDRQIEKYVTKFDKKLDKMVEQSVNKGDGNFTRLHNEEFEALFNALDRDNNVEFNLLFTPLAQENMIKLLRDDSNVAFGDDFIFKKRKVLNYIKSKHMQGSTSLDRDPESLFHFDWVVAKEMFVDYCDKYLKDVFFDLAPLISIPLYQQHKTTEYIYDEKFKFAHNVTQEEVESAANSHPISLFKHPATRSLGVILKGAFLSSTKGREDVCEITAHSFKGTDRVQYVPTMGGDGRMHNVPVKWVEYSPISKTTQFIVSDTKKNKVEFESAMSGGEFNQMLNTFARKGDTLYKKRIFSFVSKDNNK